MRSICLLFRLTLRIWPHPCELFGEKANALRLVRKLSRGRYGYYCNRLMHISLFALTFRRLQLAEDQLNQSNTQVSYEIILRIEMPFVLYVHFAGKIIK